MAYERVMGLHVTDNEEYQRYRDAMIPILHSYGGSFGYDFRIAEVLKSKSSNKINRVFTIEFPSQDIMDEFFSNAAYLKVKEQYFVNSVESVTSISVSERI